MKKIINSLICTFLIAGGALLTGCHDPEDTIDTLELDRALSPLNFEVTLEANVNAIFTWKPISSTRQYKLSLIKTEDGSTYREMKLTDDGSATTMTYKFVELPGDTEFRAELVALSTTTGNSKPVVKVFATGIEQLFLNDGVVADDDVTATSAVMRWIPESTVTHLQVDNGDGSIDRVDLDADAIRNGVYTLTGLTTGLTYTVQLCRDDAVRGTCMFVASDKATVEVVDKTGTTVTVAWSAEDQVTNIWIEAPDESILDVELDPEEQAARMYQFTDLLPNSKYVITFYNGEIECGSLTVSTLGQATVWDFTTWEIANWTENTTIQDLTILANGAKSKNVEIRADADYGVNYLDLRGKSTLDKANPQLPTERALKFNVSEEGVLVIDCYANGTGRNFYVYSDQLGMSFGPVEAPVESNKSKVYIPCPGVSRGALYIWTDATINHIYSIQWYAGSEAPGQHATPLDAPVVKAQPAEVTKGEATEVTFSWEAVANAVSYDWRIKVTHADESVETLSGTTEELSVKLDAAVVGDLKPGDYSMSVVAKPAGEYKFRPSPAGSATLTVGDTKLAAPVVTLDPNRVEVGTSTDVVASWPAVENAASYDVTFNGGAVENVTATSYTISAATVAALAEGSYTISVVAKPDVADMQASDAGEATLTVYTPSGAGTSYFWGETEFNAIWAGFANSTGNIDAVALATMVETADLTKDADGFTYKGLSYLMGGGKFKFGKNNNAAGTKAVRFQFGGSGSTSKANVSFTVDAPGTLVVEAVSGGDAARPLGVAIDDNELEPQEAPDKTQNAALLSFDCSTAVNGSKITIYSKNSGINVFSISWTPNAN